MSARIGILSDTHGLLRPEVLDHLQGCDAILHGGDINRQEILDTLSAIAPLYVVRGNNDKEWAEHISYTLKIELFGLTVFMVHKKKEIPSDLAAVDLVVYGHSHRYEESLVDGIYYINPGSCGPRRFNQPITMAILTIEDNGAWKIQRIDIPHEQSKRTADEEEKDQQLLQQDPRGLIEKVVAEINRGKSGESISRKYHISLELTETISRMYLTHPGVTADGIMTKMGL